MARNNVEQKSGPMFTSGNNPHAQNSNPHASGTVNPTGPIMLGGASGQPQEPSVPLVARAAVTSSVYDPTKAGVGPRPKRYRVLNGGHITWNGNRTVMRAGKEIDSLNYDVTKLRQQGIKLEEIIPEPVEVAEPPAAAPEQASA